MRQYILKLAKKILRALIKRNNAKLLGYKRTTKLLIIHADDLGLAEPENEATFKAMKDGFVNSASVMVPCPAVKGAADFAARNPELDIGIHLTLTSEWPDYKWRPVSTVSAASSITDHNGFFFESVKMFSTEADPRDVELEFRTQIKHAINLGINPTHLDSHMYAAFSNRGILNVYLALGKEFNLPTLLTYDLPVRTWFLKKRVFVDRLYCAAPDDYTRGLHHYYRNVLENLKPGLNCLLIHPAYDTPDMRRITHNYVNYGAAWRQEDFDFFTSDTGRKIIEENGIKLITWSEIRQKIL